MPKHMCDQELQDIERGRDGITRVLIIKLGASPGVDHSFCPGGRSEWQRSLKEAPKGSLLVLGEEVPTARAVPTAVGCFRRGKWTAEVGGRGKTTSCCVVYEAACGGPQHDVGCAGNPQALKQASAGILKWKTLVQSS